MDCKWHPGQEAYLACLNCGQKFCRVCISETHETYQCPDCHAAQVQQLASQMGARPPKGKARPQKAAPAREPKRKRGRGAPPEPAPPAVVPPVIQQPPPVQAPPPAAPAPPPAAEYTVPPAAPAPPPAAEYTVPPTTAPAPPPAVERAAPPPPPPSIESAPPVSVPEPQAPPPPVEAAPPAPEPVRPQAPPEPREETRWTVAEQAPPAQLLSTPQAAPERPATFPVPPKPPAGIPAAAPPPVPGVPEAPAVEEGKRRREPRKLKQPAEKPARRRGRRAGDSEPAPTLSSEEKEEFWGELKEPKRAGRRGSREPEPFLQAPAEPQPPAAAPPAAAEPPAAVAPPASTDAEDAVVPADDTFIRDEYAPTLRARKAKKERKKKTSEPVVAMQLPEDYDGALTRQPSYFKAVFFGLLTAVALAAAYAGFEWWRHSGRWIFGWVIGFAVGIVVVFASGRHFSWKLGLLSTGLAWFSLCLGQFAFGMLDAKYPSVLKGISIPFPTTTLLRESALALGRAFGSVWIVLFLITGLVAFLVSFRPWPVRFNVSGRSEAPRAAPPPA